MNTLKSMYLGSAAYVRTQQIFNFFHNLNSRSIKIVCYVRLKSILLNSFDPLMQEMIVLFLDY